MDILLICLAWSVLMLTALQPAEAGVHSDERERLLRFRMYKFQYDPGVPSKKYTKRKNYVKKTTVRAFHFFETTRTELLEWFRQWPVCMDTGRGSFYRQRLAELNPNSTAPFVDKSYILKELGDKVAPPGKMQSKALYLSGYRYLEDERNIDMIVKFFDVEVDKDGNELPLVQKVNKKLFAGGAVVYNKTTTKLKPLFVSETYLWEYQGTIPCVVLNFNNFKGTSYEAIRKEIAVEIRKIFAKFSYLFQPHMLSKRALNNYEIYSSGDVTHDELYNALLFIMRSIHKKYRRQIIFILNDGAESIIVNYKSSVNYLISDSFTNLKLQLLHKYANIVRNNLGLNYTEHQEGADYGGDRLVLGSGEWRKLGRSTTPRIKQRRIIQNHVKLRKMDLDVLNAIQGKNKRRGQGLHSISYDVGGKDIMGMKDNFLGVRLDD